MTHTSRIISLTSPRVARQKYVPQFGGFCAYGVTFESWWTSSNLGPSADPDAWRIIGGKLYLFMYDPIMASYYETSDPKTSHRGTSDRDTRGTYHDIRANPHAPEPPPRRAPHNQCVDRRARWRHSRGTARPTTIS